MKVLKKEDLLNLKDFTGCLLCGKIEGVDFVSSGTLEDGTKYGSSIKLKLIEKINTSKLVKGLEVPTVKLNSRIVKLACNDDELIPLIQKYNKLLDKSVVFRLELNDNLVFKALEVMEF